MTRALLIHALEKWLEDADPAECVDLVDAIRTHLAHPQGEPLFADMIAQHEGLAEELREMDKPQAMTDREAYERWAKLYGAPFYYDDLDEYSDSAWRVWQAAKATGPAWRDAPTAPGLWVSSVWVARYFRTGDIDTLVSYPNSPRWFGPIPEDKP